MAFILEVDTENGLTSHQKYRELRIRFKKNNKFKKLANSGLLKRKNN